MVQTSDSGDAVGDCSVCMFGHSLMSNFATPWNAARQASLSFTISWSLLKLMPIESMMASNHLILCPPLLLLPSIFSSITVFSSEWALCIRWPKYWSFSFNISPSNEHFHALEKEMATHSSVLAWRIPGMREPDGLPSMGSHMTEVT